MLGQTQKKQKVTLPRFLASFVPSAHVWATSYVAPPLESRGWRIGRRRRLSPVRRWCRAINAFFILKKNIFIRLGTSPVLVSYQLSSICKSVAVKKCYFHLCRFERPWSLLLFSFFVLYNKTSWTDLEVLSGTATFIRRPMNHGGIYWQWVGRKRSRMARDARGWRASLIGYVLK